MREHDSPFTMLDYPQTIRETPLPRKPNYGIPIVVLGAEQDLVMPPESVRETADFYGVEPVFLCRGAHDVMLDVAWEDAAAFLADWIHKLME
jgi:hypothetical protein